jgi:cyclophilin family peptidyl-prolyl cis-trans isomerase
MRATTTAVVLSSLFALVLTSAAVAGPAQAAAPAKAAATTGAEPVVVMKTSLGEVQIKLFKDKAPVSVANFLAYVNKKFYDGTIFHRIIPTFMVQGGGYTPDMTKKPTGAPIKNEAQNGLKNARGTLAMARTADPNSATAQFFINVADNDFLNYTAPNPAGWGYCVFGKVVDGMTVVDRIKGVPTGTRAGHKDVPLTEVLIEKATIVE